MPFTHRWSLNARGDLHAFQPSAGVQLSGRVSPDILEHKIATRKYPSSNDPGLMKTAGVLSSTPRS